MKMSALSRQNPRLLLKLSILISDVDSNISDPYEDMDGKIDLLNQTAAWVGERFDVEDVEFIYAFILENDELIEKLKRKEISFTEASQEIKFPEKKTFKIGYQIYGPATLTELYTINWDSYSEKWAKGSILHEYYDGNFDYYQGTYQGHESDNFEANNFEIDWVEPINESKKNIFSRLVVENTSELLDNLDRETLLELRNIINQKLSS